LNLSNHKIDFLPPPETFGLTNLTILSLENNR
jgi:hypothetical protein